MLKKQDFFKNNDKYQVGVMLATYNHKEFIRETMDSILMQQVTFPYKIFVADDFSTDGTFEILQEYMQKYDFIHTYRPEKNLGCNSDGLYINYDRVRAMIDTKYIALLDGDDYWTDENKLQGQYDFLEEHKECVVVYDSQYLNSTDNPWLLHEKLNEFPITDYSAFSQTATTFYRNVIDFSLYPPRLQSDGALACIFLLYGRLGYRANITSLYRQHAQGIWTSLSKEKQEVLRQIKLIMTLGFCIYHNVNPQYIQKNLDERKTQRLHLITRLQDKKGMDMLRQNELNVPYINTFKQALKERGYI